MKKSTIVWIHALIWLLFLLEAFVPLTVPRYSHSQAYEFFRQTPFTLEIIIGVFLGVMLKMLPFYILYGGLPYLLKSRKKVLLITTTTLFFLAISYLLIDLTGGWPKKYVITFVLTQFFSLVIYGLFGAGLRSVFEWFKQKQRVQTLEKQNLKSELALLRTQLNPHFLFNTLHNIDTLIETEPKMASGQLLKLSDILRYMLYDANVDQIPLEKEIEHMENYLSLQEIRLQKNNIIQYTKKGDFASFRIAPMLLIPFVENSIKHFKPVNDRGILIDIRLQEGQLNFTCINPYDPNDSNKENAKGIGLETVRKRLELLYPNQYTLEIQDKNTTFEVRLQLKPTV